MDRVEIPDDTVTFVLLPGGREVSLPLFDTVEALDKAIDALAVENKLRADYLDAVVDLVAKAQPELSLLTHGQANALDHALRLQDAKKKRTQRDAFAALRA